MRQYYGAMFSEETQAGFNVTLRIDLASPPFAKGEKSCLLQLMIEF